VIPREGVESRSSIIESEDHMGDPERGS